MERPTLLLVACPYHPKWTERAVWCCSAIGIAAETSSLEDAVCAFKEMKPNFVVIPTNGIATLSVLRKLKRKNKCGAKIATLPIERAPTIADLRGICK